MENTRKSSKIITQEMVEGEYIGTAEKIFKKFFHWAIGGKAKLECENAKILKY